MSRRQGYIGERGPARWLIRYDAGIDPATGKRRRLNLTIAGTRKDAERELRRLLRTVDDGSHVDPNRLLMRDWLARWLDIVRPEIAPKTHERYAEIVRNFLAPSLGHFPVAKLEPIHIQSFYSTLADGGRRDGKPGGLSARTRRQFHAVLSSALTRAVELKIVAANPAVVFRKKRLPRIERHELTTLSAEQSQRLLAALKHSRVYWPVLVALVTGARRGEILALRWRHIDLDRGTVTIAGSLEQTKAGVRFKSTKTERSRVVSLPAFAIEELCRRRLLQAEELLFLGTRPDGDTLVCARADGEPLQPRSLTHQFSVLMAGIKGIPRVRFHDLRHSHATQLMAAGLHPKIMQQRLGHSTITTTMDIYSHVTDQMDEEAAARLDALFRSQSRSQ